jgi:hypothetical protein
MPDAASLSYSSTASLPYSSHRNVVKDDFHQAMVNAGGQFRVGNNDVCDWRGSPNSFTSPRIEQLKNDGGHAAFHGLIDRMLEDRSDEEYACVDLAILRMDQLKNDESAFQRLIDRMMTEK